MYVLFVFMATMYMFGMYPLARYFFLNGNTASFTDISVGSAIFTALQFSIVIIFLITFLIAIHYKLTHQYNFDTGIPRMYYPLVGLIITTILLHVVFYAFEGSFTWSLFATQTLGTIAIQLVIIIKNDELAVYVKSYLSFDIFYLNVRFVCMCLCIYVFVGLCVN